VSRPFFSICLFASFLSFWIFNPGFCLRTSTLEHNRNTPTKHENFETQKSRLDGPRHRFFRKLIICLFARFLRFWMFNSRFCHRNQTLEHDGKIRKTPPKIPKIPVEEARVNFFHIFLFFRGFSRLSQRMQNLRLTACFEPTNNPSVWITAESECRTVAVGLKPLRLPRARLTLAPPESSFCFNDSWSAHQQLPRSRGPRKVSLSQVLEILLCA